MSAKSALRLVGPSPSHERTDNPLDDAFLHTYRIRALTDALQDCHELDDSSVTTLAAMAFNESCALSDCLTALSDKGAS